MKRENFVFEFPMPLFLLFFFFSKAISLNSIKSFLQILNQLFIFTMDSDQVLQVAFISVKLKEVANI